MTPTRCVRHAQPRGRPRSSRRWQQLLLYLVMLHWRWHKLLLIDRNLLVIIYVVKLRLAFHDTSSFVVPAFSSLAFSSSCKAVPRFPVLHFPPLQYNATFPVSRFPFLHFQRPRYFYKCCRCNPLLYLHLATWGKGNIKKTVSVLQCCLLL